jgi:HEAT repeat protein
LTKALSDPDWKVRRSACEALWGMGDASAVPGLVEALMDRNDVVRQAATSALEALGATAVSGLAAGLNNPHKQIAQAAADLLRRMDNDEARAALRSWGR